MRTEDKQAVDMVFEQHSKLISFLQWHYHRHYGEMVAHKFAFDVQEYNNLIILFAEQAGITFHKELIRAQISKILETMKGAYKRRSKPEFESVKSIMRVRISNNNGQRPYTRNLTITEQQGNLFFTLNLAKWCKVRGYIGYEETFTDRLRYQQIVNAIMGLEKMGVGDPSELMRLSDGRYILNLVIKEQVKEEPTKNLSGIKVLGVNLNMAQYIASVAAYDEHTGQVIDVLRVESQILQVIFTELERQAGRRHNLASCRQWVPYKKGERGPLIAARTKDDKSWLNNEYKQLTYHCVNQIINFAKRHDIRVIKIENLASFKHRVVFYKKQRKKWGNIYRMSHSKKALELHHEYKRSTKIASMFQYGLFLSDMEKECTKHCIELRIVNPFKVSQRCHKCGYENMENLESIKKFRCLKCGYSDESDVNASINVAKL